MDIPTLLHLYGMLRKILSIASVLFLLLSLVSLFLPHILVHEHHSVAIGYTTNNLTYYIESSKTGFELIFPFVCTILLLVTALFIFIQRINPLLGFSVSLVNAFILGCFYYSELLLHNPSTEFQYSFYAGTGLYLAVAAQVGMLGLAIGNLLSRKQVSFTEGLLDSI